MQGNKPLIAGLSGSTSTNVGLPQFTLAQPVWKLPASCTEQVYAGAPIHPSFIVLSRLICRPAWPLLQESLIAFRTATYLVSKQLDEE